MSRVATATTAAVALLLIALIYGGFGGHRDTITIEPNTTQPESAQATELDSNNRAALKMSHNLSGVSGQTTRQNTPPGSEARQSPQSPSTNNGLVYLLLMAAALVGLIAGKQYWNSAPFSQSSRQHDPEPAYRDTNTELLPEVKAQNLAFDGLNKHHDTLRRELQTKENVIAELKGKLAKATEKQDDKVASQGQTIAELQSELERLLKNNHELEQREKTFVEDRQETETAQKDEYDQLQSQLEGLQLAATEQIEQKEALNESLLNEIGELKGKLEAINLDQTSSLTELESLRKELTNARQDSQQQLEQQQRAMNSLESEHASALSDLHQEIDELEGKLEGKLEQGNQDKNTHDAELEHLRSELDRQQASLGQQIKESEGASETLVSEHASVLDDLHQQIDILTQELANTQDLAQRHNFEQETQLAKQTEENESLKQLLAKANRETSEALAEQESANTELAAQSTSLKDDLKQSLDDIEAQSQQHRLVLARKEEEIGSLTNALEQSEQEFAKQLQQNGESTGQLEAVAAQLRQELTIAEQLRSKQLEQLSARNVQIEQLNDEVTVLKQDLVNSSNNAVLQFSNLDELHSLNDDQKAEIERLQIEVRKSILELHKRAERIASQAHQISSLQQQSDTQAKHEEAAQNWLKRAEAAEKEFTSAQEELVTLKDKNANLEQELGHAAKQLVELESSLEQGQTQFRQLSEQNAQQQSTLSGYFSQITEIAYKSEALPLDFKPQVLNDVTGSFPDLLKPIDELEQVLGILESRNKRLATEAHDWRSRSEAVESQALDSLQELDLLKANGETVQAQLENSKLELAKLNQTLAQREQDLEQIGTNFSQRESAIAKYQSLLTRMGDKADSISVTSTAPITAVEPTHPLPADDISPQLQQLEEALNKFEAQKVRWSNDAKQWHTRAENAEDGLGLASGELETLKEAHQQIQSELQASKQALQSLKTTAAHRQQTLEQLTADTSKHKTNVSGYISSLTRVADKVNGITITPPACVSVDQSLQELPTDVSTPLDDLEGLLATLEEQRMTTSQETQSWVARAETAEQALARSEGELGSLRERSEKAIQALAVSRKELAASRETLKQKEVEIEKANEDTGQQDASAIRYLALLSKTANKISSVQLPVASNQESVDEILSQAPSDMATTLDTLDDAIGKLETEATIVTTDLGREATDQVEKLESEVQTHVVTIQRLKRGIDKLRHYQTKVKNWDNTISGYRSDIKHKTQLIDSLRDENTDLRKYETVIAEREKSIATLVTALKHDATNIRKLKRRLGRWKRRCLLLEGQTETQQGVEEPQNRSPANKAKIKIAGGAELEPASTRDSTDNEEPIEQEAGQEPQKNAETSEPIALVIDRDRPKGKTPEWVKKQPACSPRDDLTKISGIDEIMADTLFQAGISTYDQLANFGENDVKWLAYLIDAFPTKILKGKWVEQARELVAAAAAEA